MNARRFCFLALTLASVLLSTFGCRTTAASAESEKRHKWVQAWRVANPVWRGIHLGVQNPAQAAELKEQLPRLAAAGVNVVIVEVNYSFEYESHPEIREKQFITRAQARELAELAHAHGIRLIPQINCLGHQSWAKHTGALLTSHPEFDETPGQFPENKDIYCRSWCPQAPGLNAVVNDLFDELADAFEADALHVGMDEVFLIGSEYCPRCHGKDPSVLFAKAVNDLHRHIVGERKLEMLMWGDRLLDSQALHYSKWEASQNGTQRAVDLVPKDIILCDWHYEKRTDYPSVPFLAEKGFRVWPSGWQPLEAAKAFSAYARRQDSPHVLGYLCTTWGKVRIPDMAEWPCLKEPLADWLH